MLFFKENKKFAANIYCFCCFLSSSIATMEHWGGALALVYSVTADLLIIVRTDRAISATLSHYY